MPQNRRENSYDTCRTRERHELRMCVHTRTHMHACTHVCAHMHTHIHIRTRTHTRVHIQTHTRLLLVQLDLVISHGTRTVNSYEENHAQLRCRKGTFPTLFPC